MKDKELVERTEELVERTGNPSHLDPYRLIRRWLHKKIERLDRKCTACWCSVLSPHRGSMWSSVVVVS